MGKGTQYNNEVSLCYLVSRKDYLHSFNPIIRRNKRSGICFPTTYMYVADRIAAKNTCRNTMDFVHSN
jgi:hypothetical protein